MFVIPTLDSRGKIASSRPPLLDIWLFLNEFVPWVDFDVCELSDSLKGVTEWCHESL